MLPAEQCAISRLLSEQPLRPSVVGLLLEEQMAAFNQSLHKREAQEAVSLLLGELLKVYTTQDFPLRRTRTLVARLDLSCSTSISVESDPVLQEIIILTSSEVSTSHLAITRLITVQVLGQDQELASEIPYLVASAHISMAQLLHQQSDASPNSIFAAAQSAIQALESSLPGGSPGKTLEESQAPVAKSAPVVKSISTSSLATPKTPRVKKGMPRTLQGMGHLFPGWQDVLI